MAKKNIVGIYDSRTAYYISNEISEKREKTMLVVSSNLRGRSIASDLSFFVSKKIYLLYEEDDFLSLYDAKNREFLNHNIDVITKCLQEDDYILIIPMTIALKPLIPREKFEKNIWHIKIGDEIDTKKLAEDFVNMGYERVKMIYGKGQFSIRGSIIDIFPASSENPFRIELFDVEVETIKTFDIQDHSSIEKIEEISISPSTLFIYDELEKQNFINYVNDKYKNLDERREELIFMAENRENISQLEFYLKKFYREDNSHIIDYIEPDKIFVENVKTIENNISFQLNQYKTDFTHLLKKEKVVSSDFENYFSMDDFYDFVNKDVVLLSPRSDDVSVGNTLVKQDSKYQEPMNCNGDSKVFIRYLKKLIANSYKKINIVSDNLEKGEKILKLLYDNFNVGDKELQELKDKQIVKIKSEKNSEIIVKIADLSKGIDDVSKKIIYLTDIEILGGFHKKKAYTKKKKFKNTRQIETFTEITMGDYIVHEFFGVGQFIGIKEIISDGIAKDYIHIQYLGEDSLYVPVDQLDRLQKYLGGDANPPRLHRLGGVEWKKTKEKTRKEILEMAKDIVELAAIRKATKGFAFSQDGQLQREFEDDFPYEETEDQLRCIKEIKADMEKEEPMDRLLCGDVGYGKTEVSARAMFKCVMDGKQVAMLVPTTILADQHYQTLKKRFEKFPVNIEMISRFRTPKKQKEILKGIEEGKIDILVGTHKLLSKNVVFKDLGLLVIDEEQRFGVSAKEKLKNLKDNVDVLTLSATPIPRTLHTSLVGIRKMSLIEEPPHNRTPVQTYVLEEDDEIIKEAIIREVGRDGQVFLVNNRIDSVYTLRDRIEKLLPEISVSVVHGQMNEKQIEKEMIDFVENNTKVLIATTIVESGIDIPNANTLIIIDADKFGLSQLYQLKGRVGRSDRKAFAYFMHKKNKVLKEDSEKRLRAIREFTEFGAGFKISMRDLEIRGAGNLLGSQQHGHIVNVGYEMYAKMVSDAVAAIKGEIIQDDENEVTIDIKIPAYIPNYYINDESIKFEVYRLISRSVGKDGKSGIIKHIEDRFGNIPKEVLNLIKVSQIRYWAKKIDMKRIAQIDNHIIMQFWEKDEKPIRIFKREMVLDDVLEIVSMLGKKMEDDLEKDII